MENYGITIVMSKPSPVGVDCLVYSSVPRAPWQPGFCTMTWNGGQMGSFNGFTADEICGLVWPPTGLFFVFSSATPQRYAPQMIWSHIFFSRVGQVSFSETCDFRDHYHHMTTLYPQIVEMVPRGLSSDLLFEMFRSGLSPSEKSGQAALGCNNMWQTLKNACDDTRR